MTGDMPLRLFLAAYFTMVAVFYTCRLLLSKKPGKLQFIGVTGTSHWWGHVTFRVFRLAIWFVCIARVFQPAVDDFLGVFVKLQAPWLQATGVLFLLLGFALALAGHGNLADQWRSGIDPAGPGQLVMTKLYAYTRNPMYIGVLLAQAGFFLALPSIFTGVCLVIGVVAIGNQVILEERHLQARFPVAYALYRKKVNRWFPGIS